MKNFNSINIMILHFGVFTMKNASNFNATFPDGLYNQLVRESWKPVLLRGSNKKFNKNDDYKVGKQPMPESVGFTNPDYQIRTDKEILKHMINGGWYGWVVPSGYIMIDVEDEKTIEYIYSLGLTTRILITNNGVQVVFKSKHTYNSNSNQKTKSGYEVTYRVGGKNYTIINLSGRSLMNWDLTLEALPE